MDWQSVFGIFNVHTDFDHAIAHGGCADTVRESALEVDSGEGIPCHTRDLNPHQYCTWLFSQMLYQLRYPCPL